MEVFIDCTSIHDRASLHDAFTAALPFPDWYGRNLDALHDCLSSICGTVHLLNWETAEAALGTYGKNTRRMLMQTAQQNPSLDIRFE